MVGKCGDDFQASIYHGRLVCGRIRHHGAALAGHQNFAAVSDAAVCLLPEKLEAHRLELAVDPLSQKSHFGFYENFTQVNALFGLLIFRGQALFLGFKFRNTLALALCCLCLALHIADLAAVVHSCLLALIHLAEGCALLLLGRLDLAGNRLDSLRNGLAAVSFGEVRAGRFCLDGLFARGVNFIGAGLGCRCLFFEVRNVLFKLGNGFLAGFLLALGVDGFQLGGPALEEVCAELLHLFFRQGLAAGRADLAVLVPGFCRCFLVLGQNCLPAGLHVFQVCFLAPGIRGGIGSLRLGFQQFAFCLLLCLAVLGPGLAALLDVLGFCRCIVRLGVCQGAAEFRSITGQNCPLFLCDLGFLGLCCGQLGRQVFGRREILVNGAACLVNAVRDGLDLLVQVGFLGGSDFSVLVHLIEASCAAGHFKELGKPCQLRGAGDHVSVGNVAANVQQNFPALLPVHNGGEVIGHGQQLHGFFAAAILLDGRHVLFFLARDAVDLVVNGIPGVLLCGAATLALPYLAENLFQGHGLAVVQPEGAGCAVFQVVQIPVGSLCLGVPVLRPGARLAKKQPGDGVENSGFSAGVPAVNAGAVAVQLDFLTLQALEVFKAQRQKFHCVSSLIFRKNRDKLLVCVLGSSIFGGPSLYCPG